MTTAALIIDGPRGYAANEPIAGMLPLTRLILTFRQAGIKRIVIAGKDIMPAAGQYSSRMGAEFIYETALIKKQASYLENAFRHLRGKCGRLLITPANYPLVDLETVRALLETSAPKAAPVYNGGRGYPVIISEEYFDDFLAAEGDAAALTYTELEVSDEGAAFDVTARPGAEQIAEKLSIQRELRPVIKLMVSRGGIYYGQGITQLLRLADETGAVAQAEKLMGMAHSQAYKTLHGVETGLDLVMFNDRKSGQGRPGDLLTDECREFMEKFEAFEKDCEKYIEEAFKRYFA